MSTIRNRVVSAAGRRAMTRKTGRRIELRCRDDRIWPPARDAARLNPFDLGQLGHQVPTVCFFASSQTAVRGGVQRHGSPLQTKRGGKSLSLTLTASPRGRIHPAGALNARLCANLKSGTAPRHCIVSVIATVPRCTHCISDYQLKGCPTKWQMLGALSCRGVPVKTSVDKLSSKATAPDSFYR